MRPVLLEMEGFASYRQRATVDFRDTDFFVLVGPTGSGKSTVIDAMIFALYGTVPRWDKNNAVAPALAPTVNRGTVRLIFNAGGQRFVVARDVRRSKSGGVTVKEARLERFADSEAEGTVEDETTTIEAGSTKVSAAVSELLGLTFEQFTKSVALPQGEFAQFLHSTGAERQAILKSLLGYRIYDDIMRKAGSQAANEESRVKIFEEQLAGYAGATAEAVADAQTALDALNGLQKHITEVAVPGLQASLGQGREARARAEQLTAERNALAGIAMPANVTELDAESVERTQAVELTRAEAARLEELDTAARAELQQAPPRHELELVIANWRTLSTLETDIPVLATEASEATTALETAIAARSVADAAADRARAASTEAERAAEQHEQELAEAEKRLLAVKSLRAPEGIDELGNKQREANAVLAEAKSTVSAAETGQVQATEALKATTDTGALVEALGALDNIRAALVEDLAGATERANEVTEAAEARARATSAANATTEAERLVRDIEHADLAATLRTGLAVGDDCPVCGQSLKAPPTVDISKRVDEAREQLERARTAQFEADQQVAQLEAACTRSATLRGERIARAELERLKVVQRAAALRLSLGELANPIDVEIDQAHLRSACDLAESLLTSVRAMQEQRNEGERRRREADAAVDLARNRLREAETSAAAVQSEVDRARSALGAARDAVINLGPPSVEDADIASAWYAILHWAAGQLADLGARRTSCETAAKDSRKAADDRGSELGNALNAAVAAGDKVLDATTVKTEAATQLENATAKHAALTEQLADSPDLDDAQQQLAEVVSLQTQVDQLSSELTRARSAVAQAEGALADNELALSASWQQLRNMRDPLACFGAPAVGELSLTETWRLMVDWAQAEAASRSAKIDAELGAAAEAEERAATAQASLITDLAALEICVTDSSSAEGLTKTAPVAVAGAVATATAERDRAKERVEESSELGRKLEAARESAAVARRLAQLMHANQFPQWLIASALDSLLEEASSILMEISGGQFELRRKEGDLEVIDHNDADMPRPVKTLSGGETFQASLALALALSSQVTALSASGGKTLESILLDEGFGTLDENTLDVVASTLENLASAGSRMVGVITHVAGLAERVPVRFSVHRDTMGSHIQREAL